jgi:ATPase involved in DNA repair
MPQESANVTEIVGLSYQNFKRTIIIPQGQFKEFLELGATDRTKMLKEIFNLQRFDLQAKTAGLFAETRSLLDQQEGQLLGFEQITAEGIALKKEQLQEAERIFSEKEINYKAASGELQQLMHLKADMELLEQKKQDFGQLQAQKPAQDARAAELALFEKLQGAFATLLFHTGQTQTELQQRQEQAAQERINLAQLREEGALIRKNLEVLQAAMLTMPQKRIEEMELSFVGQWLRLNQEITAIRARQEKGIAFVKAAAEKVKCAEGATRAGAGTAYQS